MSTRQLFTVTTTATDQELIRHFCSTEDAHSLRILTDRHYAPVQLYVSRRLADREAVRDITQDVFERLILLIQRPDFVVRDLHQLLYTIAAGKLIDHYRRVGREGSISLSQVDDLHIPAALQDSLPSAEDLLLRRLFRRFPPEQRRCARLFYLHHYTYQDIAGIIGCEKARVRANLQTVRRKLRQEAEGKLRA
ncbi:MAG: sigma-70 family RNA polymerase sigma factor [Saprospiraceae bacterium]